MFYRTGPWLQVGFLIGSLRSFWSWSFSLKDFDSQFQRGRQKMVENEEMKRSKIEQLFENSKYLVKGLKLIKK
jgi:hypothetical protein